MCIASGRCGLHAARWLDRPGTPAPPPQAGQQADPSSSWRHTSCPTHLTCLTLHPPPQAIHADFRRFGYWFRDNAGTATTQVGLAVWLGRNRLHAGLTSWWPLAANFATRT